MVSSGIQDGKCHRTLLRWLILTQPDRLTGESICRAQRLNFTLRWGNLRQPFSVVTVVTSDDGGDGGDAPSVATSAGLTTVSLIATRQQMGQEEGVLERQVFCC